MKITAVCDPPESRPPAATVTPWSALHWPKPNVQLRLIIRSEAQTLPLMGRRTADKTAITDLPFAALRCQMKLQEAGTSRMMQGMTVNQALTPWRDVQY